MIQKYVQHIIKDKSVATERIIRILRNKINKYVTSNSKNIYLGKLDVIVNEKNKIYHSTIKIKLADVKSSIYFDF